MQPGESRSVKPGWVYIRLLDAETEEVRQSFASRREMASGRVAGRFFIPVVLCGLVCSTFMSRQKPLDIMARNCTVASHNRQSCEEQH